VPKVSQIDQRQSTSKWYDGFIYDKLITPLEGEIVSLVDGFIPAGSSVIDIGCGPGSLALKLSTKCKMVAGLDISDRMIAYANRQKVKMGANNVTFICEDAAKMRVIYDEKFSFAILSQCLHGMSGSIRQDVIKNSFLVSEKAIISDFLSPWPRDIRGAGQIILEKIEGRESFNNFQDWYQKGGVGGFVEQLGLQIIDEKPWLNGFGKTILVSE
jgi:SAM-dependent methyltransferase